jgi:hypothetical protein
VLADEGVEVAARHRPHGGVGVPSGVDQAGDGAGLLVLDLGGVLLVLLKEGDVAGVVPEAGGAGRGDQGLQGGCGRAPLRAEEGVGHQAPGGGVVAGVEG